MSEKAGMEETEPGQLASSAEENALSNNTVQNTPNVSEKTTNSPETIERAVEKAVEDPEELSNKRIKLEEASRNENEVPIANPATTTGAPEAPIVVSKIAPEGDMSPANGPGSAQNSLKTVETTFRLESSQNGDNSLSSQAQISEHPGSGIPPGITGDLEFRNTSNEQESTSLEAIKDETSALYNLEDIAVSDALSNSLTAIRQFNEGTPPFEAPPVVRARSAVEFSGPEVPVLVSKMPPNMPPAPAPYVKRNRLVIIYDKPRFPYMKIQLEDYRNSRHDVSTIVELGSIETIVEDAEISKKDFFYFNFCLEYNDEFQRNLRKMADFIDANSKVFQKVAEIGYHFMFDSTKKWSDYSVEEKVEYKHFLDTLSKVAGDKVVQCSVINKYEINTVYLTEKDDLAKLGQEIQDDIQHWKNLRVFDYGENCIRFLPGVRFPDSLETINIGGGYSLETLTGFKMPSKLKVLVASNGAITSLDNINFPYTLERLNLLGNKIYFLNYVEFPPRLVNLDLSQNRIDSLRGVNFPRSLKSLSLSHNPIECIKGAKFHEGMEYLDLSCIPNESMTGVKFPDLLVSLNLQQSMTNTRGLKLPPYLKKVNLGFNGVNSINPLKLPNTLESLYLANNNIKTLNKVQFPTALKELYLGNNMITTLKNVQFPHGLEVLDFEMVPELDETEKHITTLKDVVFPPNLKVLKLGYHSIKAIEAMEFPPSLISLSLMYNELKVLRNVRFGTNLKILDLSGNQELTNIDYLLIPESVVDLRIPAQLVESLPAYIVERANRRQMVITQLAPFAT